MRKDPQHFRKTGNDASAAPIPTVGIGASAGGLAAFEAFFAHLSADTQAAFVIIELLAPKSKRRKST